MIVEERIYTLIPGNVKNYLTLYETEGMPAQTRILGKMLGYYFTEFGPLNQIVHLWGYDDLQDRETRRKALFADDDWNAYLKKMRPMLHTQECKILNPAPFFDPLA